MNKRLYNRMDVSHELIPVTITCNGKERMIGVLKDISKIGISFYNYENEVLSSMGKYVDVFFQYDGTIFQYELEILREEKETIGYVCAGKFMGLPCLLQKQKRHLLDYAEEKELVLV